jgi:hypothetical protein
MGMPTVPVSPRVVAALISFAVVALALSLVCATASADYTVMSCGQYANEGVWSELPAGTTFDLGGSACPAIGFQSGLAITANRGHNQISQLGHRAAWNASAPAGLEIVGASTSDLLAAASSSYSISSYWAGGTEHIANTQGDVPASWSGFASPYFGFQIACNSATCPTGDTASLYVYSAQLDVHETVPPSLNSGAGLWAAQGWVRGQWPLSFNGSSPSGMCGLSASLDQLPLTSTVSASRDPATWVQCSAPALSTSINTASYGDGSMPLQISGYDAAGGTAGDTETIYVDNSTPTLSLNGPTNAPSTAGTQYVTATAGGSPSGIDEIGCSVDGSPATWYGGASAQVPVSGLGEHTVSCNAYNNAVDANGTHGESPTQTWSLKIGAPTVMGVGFAKYVGLRCHVVKRRETIRGHWVTRTRHGKQVKVKSRTRHTIVKVTKCHPETKRVRVVARVPVKHHGKIVRRHGRIVYRKRVEDKRVVVMPHWKSKATEHVGYGHATSVSGWLGLSDGIALAGQPVQILTAPENGLGQFAVATTATTAPDGTWTANLPAGPSRLIEASYGGGGATEATVSDQVKVIVPSKIEIQSIAPARVAWEQSVRIKGTLLGGYLPAGGVNLRLRIGIGEAKATYGVQEHVAGNGRFTTSYTFGAGESRTHRRYWFQIATLPSGNYPYAPSSSHRIYVEVGGHPPHRHARQHRHRARKHRHRG